MLAVPFVDELASGVAPASAPDLARVFGVDGGTAAAATLIAFQALAFFVEPPLLAWSERVRARFFSSASLFVVALSCFASAFVENRWIFLASLAVFGPAIGCANAIAEGMLVESRPNERERTMARLSLAGVAGDLAVPALLGAAAMIGRDFRAIFVVAGVVSLALALVHFSSGALDRPFTFRDDDDEDDADVGWREGLRVALRRRALLAWSFANASATLLDEIFVAFGAVHLASVGATASERAWAIGAWVVGGSIALAAMERFVARFDARGLLVFACAITALSLTTIAMTRTPSIAVVAFFFVGVGGSALHPLTRARAYASLPGRPALVHAVAAAFGPFDLLAPIPLAWLCSRFHPAAAILALLVSPCVVGGTTLLSTKVPLDSEGHASDSREP